MSRKPKMHRTRIEPDGYEVVQEIIKTNPDIKGTQAAVRHALLLYPQVNSLKAQLVLSEQRGDDWKERAEKANPQVEKLKQVVEELTATKAYYNDRIKERDDARREVEQAKDTLQRVLPLADRPNVDMNEHLSYLVSALNEAREEEAAVLKGEREENEVLKTRLHEAERARDDAQRSCGVKDHTIALVEKERDQQRDRAFELEKEAARWRPGMVWLWGACVGACVGAALVFTATAIWG